MPQLSLFVFVVSFLPRRSLFSTQKTMLCFGVFFQFTRIMSRPVVELRFSEAEVSRHANLALDDAFNTEIAKAVKLSGATCAPELLAPWVAARIASMLLLWPVSDRTRGRVPMWSQTFEYPKSTASEVSVVVTLELTGLEGSHVDHDVLILGFDDREIASVERNLDLPVGFRLSPAPGPMAAPIAPLRGTVFYLDRRVVFPLVVCRRDGSCPVNTLFFVDTCAPLTYLRKETMEALGFEVTGPDDVFPCRVGHIAHFSAGISKLHFKNVDLLGMDWLATADAGLFVRPKSYCAVMSFGDMPVPVDLPVDLRVDAK